jgi:hypothetical protein
VTWRVGRKLGRTLYRDEVCVGILDTPEMAAEFVTAMNDLSLLRALLARAYDDDVYVVEARKILQRYERSQ